MLSHCGECPQLGKQDKDTQPFKSYTHNQMKTFEEFCTFYNTSLCFCTKTEKRFRYIWYVEGWIDGKGLLSPPEIKPEKPQTIEEMQQQFPEHQSGFKENL